MMHLSKKSTLQISYQIRFQFVYNFFFPTSLGPEFIEGWCCLKLSAIARWDVPCCRRVLWAGSEMELGKDVPPWAGCESQGCPRA